jgi:hypothetical protein
MFVVFYGSFVCVTEKCDGMNKKESLSRSLARGGGYTHRHTNTHKHSHTHPPTHTHTHTHTHIHAHTHIHTHTHTHIGAPRPVAGLPSFETPTDDATDAAQGADANKVLVTNLNPKP